MSIHRAMLLGLLLGCGSDKGSADAVAYAGDSSADGFAVRVDIHPSGSSNLQPQSFPVDDLNAGRLLFDLAPTVRLSGTVTGFDFAPLSSVTVPGDPDVPVISEVRARIPGTIVSTQTRTDAKGEWALELPAGTGYEFSVIPETPAPLPFYVEAGLAFSGSQRRDIALGAGVPIFGQVRQDDDGPLPEGTVARLRDRATGVEGPPHLLNSAGQYLLRALPGDYELIIEGEPTSPAPRIAQVLQVGADAPGVEVNLNVGHFDITYVEGRVYDAEGDDQEVAVVRFLADALDPRLTVEATALHETTTNSDGQFRRGILAGDWIVEIIPPYEDDGDASPYRFPLEVDGSGEVSLGRIELPARTQAQSQVLDEAGNPVSGVIVNFTERGFDGFSYSETTNNNGQFSRRLPNVPMDLTLVPPTPNTAVTRMVIEEPGDLPDLQLDVGVVVTGEVTGAGASLSYALVEIYADDGAFLGSTVTDGGGTFSLQVRAAPPGLGDTGNLR